MEAALRPDLRLGGEQNGLSPLLVGILDRLDATADELAERMLNRFLATIPSYGALPDETLAQIRAFNARMIRGFLAGLRVGNAPGPVDTIRIRESAALRAREGVPLSGLLAAYRAGGQLAWQEALMLIGDDPELMRAGLELATALMRWLDEASAAAASAYLAEYEHLATDRESARRDFIDAALGGTLTPDEVVARSGAMGLDPHAPHVIALIEADRDAEATLRAVQHQSRALVDEASPIARALTVARGDELIVVCPCGEGTEEEIARAVRTLIEKTATKAGLVAGIGRARSTLTEIGSSYHEASIALTAARAGSPGDVALYGEVLLEELILRERSVARRLAQTVLDPLERHPELRETLVEFIRHGPSLPSVAKRLFLHPNTVAYRLSRIRELTGRDPKTPAGIAELFLALRARQLVGAGPA
ncbi:MAG: helix-turn-helix domain-containing protein [Actinobacteria bacterium]|nr:helix-turn-helix domain-containing protein [Actinomycetota bacterium]